MIVIGVDVHKQSLTAVAVDEAGRALVELTAGSASELLVSGQRRSRLSGCGRLVRVPEADGAATPCRPHARQV